MTVSDKPEDIYAVAARCLLAAIVLSDPKADKIRVLCLGNGQEHTERETAVAIAAGLTKQAGVLGLTATGELQAVAKPGFEWAMARASVVFREAILEYKREIAELERIAGLMDPRAQA
jgi:hypothetical protein